MAKNYRELKSIGEIIPLTIKKIGQEKVFGKYFVILNWENIVGKEVANNSSVFDLDRGKLIIKTRNSVWSHHLLMLKKEIITKVNSYCGKNVVNDLWFMAGYQREKQNNDLKENKEAGGLPKLTEPEIKAAKLIVEGIKDVEIRHKITKVLLKNMAFKKAKEAKNWPRCLKCEVLVEPGEKYCTVCRINKNSAAQDKIRFAKKMFQEYPWLSFEELKKYIDLSRAEYTAAKKSLAASYIDLIFKGNEFCQTDLTMLLKEIEPKHLTQQAIDEVMAEIKKRFLKTGRKRYVFTSGS
ncbi:MAG: DUF721 domain-containing protein [Sporomusaceae bacterium]|jgi:hypothetical protein|nr:DUF721 domain-containing protein [Sporomusaceae bacterium]